MTNTVYTLIFTGEAKPGRDLEEVKRNVAKLYGVEVEDIEEKLFCGKEKVIKQCPDRASAEHFKNLFERTGAVCRVETVDL